MKILAIDGGGIKGLYTLYLLREIENRLCGNNKIYEYFDVICGTSIGGIITLGLTSGIPIDDIIKIFENNANAIFDNNDTLIKKIKQWFGYKYDSRNLRNILVNMLGDRELNKANNMICIPTYNASTGQPILFNYYGNNNSSYRDSCVKMVDIAMATSAAPTLFPMYKIDSEHISGWFVDGGIWANEALITIPDIVDKLDVKQYNLLSIGNISPSIEVNKFCKNYWNILRISKLIETIFYCFSFATIKYINLITKLTNSVFVRIDHNIISNEYIDNINLDSSNELILNKLKQYALEDAEKILGNDSKFNIKQFFMAKK